MITKIPPRVRNLFFLVRYVAQKQGAREIDTNLLPGTPREQADQIEELAKMYRSRMERIGKHMILSFPPGEERPVPELRSMVTFYRREMGYADAPFVAYFHTDTQHPHIHIVTTPVTFDGRAVSESWDWPRSEKVARAMEKRWKLQMVPSSETAQRRAPTSEEVHQEARTGKLSDRELFRSDIEDVARQVGSLQEATEALSARGYEVHLRRDRHGVLRGLSFERDGVQFRASQLGRAFSGNRFLSTFSLADSLTDAAPGTPAPASDLLSPVERSVDMSPPSLALPPGRYDIAFVRPQQITGAEQRIPQGDARKIRKSLPHYAVEKTQHRLQQDSARRVPILRPCSGEGRFLGFRDVDDHQIRVMRRDGYEPHLLVQHGDRFDLLLKTHARVSRQELLYLRDHLERRYGLPEQRGVFIDAIRAPVTGQAPADDLPRLAEVREAPFSASQKALRDSLRAARQQEVLDASVGVAPEPEAPDRDFPRSPNPALAEWEETFQSSARPPSAAASASLTELDDEGLFHETRRANRAVIQAAIREPETSLLPSYHAQQLTELTHELDRRIEAHGTRLADLEAELHDAARIVDDLLPGDRGNLKPAHLDTYHRALRSLADLQESHRQTELEYSTLLGTRATHHLYRFEAAVEQAPSREDAEALAQLIVREAKLYEPTPDLWTSPAVGPEASLPELEDHLQATTDRRHEALQRLLSREPEAAAEYRRAVREELTTERHLALRKLQIEVNSTKDRVEDLNSLARHRELLAQLGEKQSAIYLLGSGGRDRLALIAERVAHGDFSPESLRRLNGEIVAAALSGKPVIPRLPEQASTPQELLQRFQAVRTKVTRLAEEVAQSDKPSLEKLSRLFQASSEGVHLHQRFDHLQRQALKLADPDKPPAGVSQQAWLAGWLRLAQDKGLSRPEAVSHVLNAGRVTSGLGMVGGLGTSLGMRAISQATSLAIRHVQEVLKR